MAPYIKDNRKSLFLHSIEACLIALVLLVPISPVLAMNLPVDPGNRLRVENPSEQENTAELYSDEASLPDFQSFFEIVQNGEKGVLRGVYVPGVLALPIVQQPAGNPGYVSQNNDEITQFNMAAEAGIVGLLAHNYLSGTVFFDLSKGQEVRLIYGNGEVEYFEIDQILKYQALQPYSPTSQFRDLETDLVITAEQLFGKVYRGERHVTFQTCIDANGNSSWGRIFIIAQPKLFPHSEQQYIHDNLLPVLY